MKNNIKNTSQFKTIGLPAACELLVLPNTVVRALCHSPLIWADMMTKPPSLKLDDVIAVATVLNSHRAFHTEVILTEHEKRLWEALDAADHVAIKN